MCFFVQTEITISPYDNPGGMNVGIERTDIWLEEYFNQPLKLIKEHLVPVDGEDEKRLYDYLRSFGMYSPNSLTKARFKKLKEQGYWSKVNRIFHSYHIKWKGPDVPVYTFPIQSRMEQGLSGLSFKNKIFLFVSPTEDIRQLEALVVHEYHHVCRLNESPKLMKEYTLLQSMLMEGFAEWAVRIYCGEEYNAKWTRYYTDDQLERFYIRYVKSYLEAKRTDRIHDVLLFGKGFYPELLGYSIGYWLIKKANEKRKFSISETFTVTPEEIKSILEL